MAADVATLTIDRLGAQGDGVAGSGPGGAPVYVPFALPGERVEAVVEGERGRLLDILEESPQRIAPVCRHFGRCGGCALQNLASAPYLAWKRDMVAAAFRARGLNVEPAAVAAPAGRRRRAAMSAERGEHGVCLGFHEAHSHHLIDVHECPVTEPRIVAALPKLRELLGTLLSRQGEARVTITAANGGLDVGIDGVARKLTPDVRTMLAGRAQAMGLARLTLAGETVFEALPPALSFGAAEVVLPSGTFIQAMAAAEHEMARLVVAAVGKAKTVADLFSGLGAFTFPLAQRARVSAFDSDAAAIAALSAAVKHTTGVKPITARVRDLFREPLSALELNEHEAAVFDPPRAGAEAQARMLAKSKVKTVVAVSCNPATLARDARMLVDGGYKIETVTPVDQFVYSAHIEAVAVFRR